ncbi:MAG: DNA polymerase III subunit gamma/tau [Prevotella sp.]|nr:DNA polymerase III subunit gamma/tau [Prevotella sp.]
MEEYIVSARKYRPMSFDTVVGQQALTTTLKNAVSSGKLAHAYLFCGPRGVGKTTCARIFAKAINCMHPTADGEACNECESCKAFNEQRSFNIFELDAASNNSVESIKSLMEQTRIPPQVGKYKVFIIDEVHMLSQQAFNAFLKTLEEPPSYVVFILATTEKHKILPTILSRCQIYDFERMNVPSTVNHLKMVAEKEGISYEEEALTLIAEKADGGMRDALSIFDQAASFCQGNITYAKVIEDLNELDADNYFKMVDMALQNKVTELMMTLNGIINRGFDAGNVITGLASHLRNVMMAKDPSTLTLLETSQQQVEKYKQQATKCPTNFLYRALKILNRCDLDYRQSNNKRLLVELTLIEMAQLTQPDDDTSAGRGPKRLKCLFKYIIAAPTTSAAQVAPGAKPLLREKKVPTPANDVPTPSAPTATTASVQPTTTVGTTASAATAASTAKPLKLKGLGMTFASLKQQEKDEKVNNAAEVEIKNKDENANFNDDDLQLQWLAMCNRILLNKEMTALAQRMKNVQVKITSLPNIEVLVDNKLLLDEIEGIKGRIRASLAATLHNGHINISTRLARQEERTRILSPREILDKMQKENEAVAMLASLLKLEMA